MLAGTSVTERSRAHAREMLEATRIGRRAQMNGGARKGAAGRPGAAPAGAARVTAAPVAALLVAAALLAAGCSKLSEMPVPGLYRLDVRQGNAFDDAALAKLEIGMPRSRVLHPSRHPGRRRRLSPGPVGVPVLVRSRRRGIRVAAPHASFRGRPARPHRGRAAAGRRRPVRAGGCEGGPRAAAPAREEPLSAGAPEDEARRLAGSGAAATPGAGGPPTPLAANGADVRPFG